MQVHEIPFHSKIWSVFCCQFFSLLQSGSKDPVETLVSSSSVEVERNRLN